MRKKRILIVDDEWDILSVLERGLTREGYSVIKSGNGNDALLLARTECPDLIILDLEMPDMYGGDIARMLKEDPKTQDIPVMFLTGMFPKEEERNGGRVVAGHVLVEKPYNIFVILSAIDELLQKKVLCES